MNAVEKALRHIEQLQKRLIKAMPPKQPKPAKRQTAPKKTPDQIKPRVVSKRRRHTSAQREYNPPVTHPDVSELAETFAPGPITPAFPLIDADTSVPVELFAPVKVARPTWADAWERAHPSQDMAEAPKVAPAPVQARARGSCKAIDADTGRQCRLLEHPEEPDRHRNERGAFFRVLAPGAVPKLRQTLDSWAWDGREESDRQSDAQQKVASRRRLAKGERRRDGHGALKAAINRIQMEASL